VIVVPSAELLFFLLWDMIELDMQDHVSLYSRPENKLLSNQTYQGGPVMDSRERVLSVLNHKEPDRVPVDFGSFSGATSMNVFAYRNLLKYLGIEREARVENLLMFTAEIDNDILDMFHVDTNSVKPSIPLTEFNAPEEFMYEQFQVKWLRSTDFTYAPVEGPFQKITNPTLDDLKKFRSGRKRRRGFVRRLIEHWSRECHRASSPMPNS
jgi:hypothetical protein